MSSALEFSWKRLASSVTGGEPESRQPSLVSDYLTSTELRLLDSLPGLVSIHARNGNLIWANGDFCSQFDVASYSADVRYLDSVNPQDHVVILNAIAHSGKSDDAVQIRGSKRLDGKSSGNFTLELNCTDYEPQNPVFDEPLVLVSGRDVTAELERIQALEETNQSTVAQSQQRNNLFAAMSHELRTPLNAIIGFSELLEGKAAIRVDDAKKLEYAGIINESATNLLQLINDVLDLSKLEAGKHEVCQSEVNLESLLTTVQRTLEPISSKKSVDVIVENEEFLPSVHSDERLLNQIFTNLLSNAIKFSDQDGEVRVSFTRRRNGVEVCVADTGIGMSEETVQKLGDVFFQAGPTISRDYQGTGLGLAIAYELAALLGGKICVESELGRGSEFIVQIPITPDQARPVSAPPSGEIVYLNREKLSSESGLLPINGSLG